MRFGGHETFPVREGWLHRGLTLINRDASAFNDPYVADTLGVGRNMAKSVRHWLIAARLVLVAPGPKGSNSKSLEPSDLGRLVLRHDPYMLQVGTWIAFHVNLVNNPMEAQSWQWFFSRYSLQRFDRIACSEALKRNLDSSGQRPPVQRTLQRDVACLLASYATPVPSEHTDPEDASDSPFRRLGLLTYFRDSHLYQRNEMEVSSIPHELLGYAASISGATRNGDLPLREACFADGALGRCLQLGLDAFIALVEKAEEVDDRAVRIVGSAGERRLHIAHCSRPEQWLEAYYSRIAIRAVAA